jgi:polysaccharide export outer membrane protein
LRTTYVIGHDDQILIHALDVPEISDKPQRIDSNGDVRLPIVGRIHVAGSTVEQVEAELVTRLKTFLKAPDVSVSVVEVRSEPVSVIGAVGSAGVRQLDGVKTLIEVLAIAGGPSADAGPIVRITRRLDQGRIPLPEAVDNVETGFSVVEIPLLPLLDAASPEKNIVIRPNDVISIPRARVVYVIGEVSRVGSVPVTRGDSVSVVEAIASAGGVLRTAAASGARILRLTQGSQTRTEIPVDVNKIMQGRSADVRLSVGDILVVPDSKGKRATTRAVEIAIQLGLLVGTYGLIH